MLPIKPLWRLESLPEVETITEQIWFAESSIFCRKNPEEKFTSVAETFSRCFQAYKKQQRVSCLPPQATLNIP